MQAASWATLAMCLHAALGLCAQNPPHCRSPPIFTGSLTVTAQKEQMWSVGKYSYDSINQRIHFGEIGNYNNYNFTFDALILFKERVLYEINYQKQYCVKKPLHCDFHPMGVPKDARFMSQVVLGSSSIPGESLLVNTWVDMKMQEGQPGSGSYLLTITDHGCLPVSALYNTKNLGWLVMSFFDNTLQADRSVFIPPPFCKDADLEIPEDGEKVDFFSVFH